MDLLIVVYLLLNMLFGLKEFVYLSCNKKSFYVMFYNDCDKYVFNFVI